MMFSLTNLFRDMVTYIFNNIDTLESINTFMEFFSYFLRYIFPIFLIIYSGLKFLYNLHAKRLLKLCLCKDELKSLKYYVPTYGQETLSTNILSSQKQRFCLIDFFIKDVFQKEKDDRYFIILGESGMGKSTFLQMLYIKYKREIFKSHQIYLYPLSNEVDFNEWKEIKNKYNSILLLDALDENSDAVRNYEETIAKITKATEKFYKVIITCRTQFFPDEQSEPKHIKEIKYGTKSKNQQFYKIYISKFNRKDICLFLRKRYKFHIIKRILAKKIIDKCDDLMARPMILSYIDELMKHSKTYSCITDIYEKIIYEWLHREPVNEELLKEFTNQVMRYMFINDVSSVSQEIIRTLCSKEEMEIINPILARTRSLLTRNSIGEYRFAHKSIYEYLIAYEAIYNDFSLRIEFMNNEKNIDLKFYQELSRKLAKQYLNNVKFYHSKRNDKFHDKLSSTNLSYLDLSHVDLSQANLSHVKLVCTRLSDTNLSEANLSHAILSDALLPDAILSNANLSEADLSNANLRCADLSSADLSNANLRCADLSSADLFNAKLRRADLSGANLSSANLRWTVLSGAKLSNAKLRSALLSSAKLFNTKLRRADLFGANLFSAKLRSADLSGADLSSANLRWAVFSGAKLSNAKLTDTKPNREIVRTFNLKNVIFKAED